MKALLKSSLSAHKKAKAKTSTTTTTTTTTIMKLYLPTSIATLMLLGVPSFTTAKTDEFRMIRGRDAQNQYTDEERNSPAAVRRLDKET